MCRRESEAVLSLVYPVTQRHEPHRQEGACVERRPWRSSRAQENIFAVLDSKIESPSKKKFKCNTDIVSTYPEDAEHYVVLKSDGEKQENN